MNNEYIPFIIFLGFGVGVFVFALAWRDFHSRAEKRNEPGPRSRPPIIEEHHDEIRKHVAVR